MTFPHNRRFPPKSTQILVRSAVVAVFFATIGCSRQDSETLAVIGRKILRRSQDVTAGFREQANEGWRGIRGNGDVRDRVVDRIRFDKRLVGSKLSIRVEEKTVNLGGTVLTAEQKQRAVEIAENTSGVEAVVDAMEIGEMAKE